MLLYIWSLWYYFVLIFREIQILLWGFSFLAKSKSFCVQSRLLVTSSISTVAFLCLSLLFFLFVYMLILAAVISLSLQFFEFSLNTYVDVSTQFSILASYLPLFFFLTHGVYLWVIPCASSSSSISLSFLHSFEFFLYPFKNGPDNLTSDTAQVSIHLRRFLMHNLVMRSFLFFWDALFLFFSFISVCLMVSASNIQKNL